MDLKRTTFYKLVKKQEGKAIATLCFYVRKMDYMQSQETFGPMGEPLFWLRHAI